MTSTNDVGSFVKKPLGVFGATVGLSIAVAIITFFVKKIWSGEKVEKCDEVSTVEEAGTTPKLDDPDKWIEIGRIKELYYYPLKSGKGKAIENCDFTDYGVSVHQDGLATLKDRMLLVYSGKNGKFQTARNYPDLLSVKMSAVDENFIKLEADGASSVVFRLPEKQSDKGIGEQECSMWWGESLKCIDCGPEPAAWISKFLTGTTDSNLRIGSAIAERRDLHKGPWAKFTKVYKNLRNEDTGYFADLASYMLMSESSIDELNKRLERSVTALQFRPNIVVKGGEPFDEDSWEWIKIGKNVLLRNVKPCSRCSMIRINPETGVVDKDEPTKTLQSFREQTIPERVKVDGKYPTIGIYCGLYEMGPVKIGDKVFVQRCPAEKT